MYDVAIARWHVIDPLAHKYYSYSPYVYVGNNPIRRTDPDGKRWKDEKEEKKAEKTTEKLGGVNDKLTAKIGTNSDKIAEAKDKEKDNKVDKLEAENKDLRSRISVNSKTIKAIGAVGRDKRSFRFGSKTTQVGNNIQATLSRDKDGTYVINNMGNLGNTAHEIMHAKQVTQGKITIIRGTDQAIIRTPGLNEQEGYRAEHGAAGSTILNTNSIDEITPERIQTEFPETYNFTK